MAAQTVGMPGSVPLMVRVRLHLHVLSDGVGPGSEKIVRDRKH
jgi:hypothetical protein